MGAASQPRVLHETRLIKEKVRACWDLAHQDTSQSEEANYLARLIQFHREGHSPEEINRLPVLNFAVRSTATRDGVRFVLWWPVVELLRVWQGEPVDQWIETWICGRELAIAFVSNSVAAFLEKITPFVEGVRRGNPFKGPHTSLRMTIMGLQEAENEFVDLEEGELIASLHRALVFRSRFAANLPRQQPTNLVELASRSPNWAIQACVEFLEFAQQPMLDEPPIHLAIASESSLAADWLRPEEDEAWSDL